MVADFWQDLRYGARMLVKNSGFSLIAIIMHWRQSVRVKSVEQAEDFITADN